MFNKISKDDFFTNTLVIAATELIIMHGGMRLMSMLYNPLFSAYLPAEPRASECYMYSIYYLTFLIPIGLCLLYMRLTKAEKLHIFTKGGFSGFLKATAVGLLIGFGTNALLSILCGITGTVTYTFNAFTRYLPILAITAFFQCSCEEFLLRAYAASYMEEHSHWSAAAFISGALFIFHHTGNLNLYGFDYRFCLNVFLIGVFLYLLLKVTGNFWSC